MARQVYVRKVSQQTTADDSSWYQLDNLIWYIFGLFEVLLTFRLIFRLFGASRVSGFVNFIYGVSNPLVAPFSGIFPVQAEEGLVFDPSILVAMLVYLLLAKIIVDLLAIISNREIEE